MDSRELGKCYECGTDLTIMCPECSHPKHLAAERQRAERAEAHAARLDAAIRQHRNDAYGNSPVKDLTDREIYAALAEKETSDD